MTQLAPIRAISVSPVTGSKPAARPYNRWSIKIVGSTAFCYRHRTRPDGYQEIAFYPKGRRRDMYETRSTPDAFKKRAEQLATEIANGRINMASMQEADRSELLRAREDAHKAKKALLALTSSYADMVRRLPSPVRTLSPASQTEWTVEQIFEIGLQNLPAGITSKTFPEVLSEMLRNNSFGERWKEDLESRAGKFGETYTGPIADLRAPAISKFLLELDVAPRTRNNYRIALSTVFSYARENNYLPRTWSELEQIKPAKLKKKRALIYAPEEMGSFIAAALDSLIAYLALAAFAGIRNREIMGDAEHPPLDWRDVRFDQNLIYIPSEVAKGKTPDRIIPMQPNLRAWLEPHRKTRGPICTLKNVTNALKQTADRAGITFLRNGLRKSFISYRLAIRKDIGAVADEAGNSPSEIKETYRDPRPEFEALAYFNLSPSTVIIPGRARQLPLNGI